MLLTEKRCSTCIQLFWDGSMYICSLFKTSIVNQEDPSRSGIGCDKYRHYQDVYVKRQDPACVNCKIKQPCKDFNPSIDDSLHLGT